MAICRYWTSNRAMGREKMVMEIGKELSWQDMPLYRLEGGCYLLDSPSTRTLIQLFGGTRLKQLETKWRFCIRCISNTVEVY
jgi:hypothetical protein